MCGSFLPGASFLCSEGGSRGAVTSTVTVCAGNAGEVGVSGSVGLVVVGVDCDAACEIVCGGIGRVGAGGLVEGAR